MKFYREINHENAKAFSIFFGIFSLVLMGLGFLTDMPWYFCFLFIAFTLVCAGSVVDSSKCALEDGLITYFRHCRRRKVDVRDANLMLLTEYCGPLRSKGAKNYVVKDREHVKRNRIYIDFIRSDNLKLLGKCTNNHFAKIYYKGEGELVFSMMYEPETFAELLKSFDGQVYVMRDLYEAYRRELDRCVKEAKFDYSKVFVLGRAQTEEEAPEEEEPEESADDGETDEIAESPEKNDKEV